MPKVVGTRKQKAKELLRMLNEGPYFPFAFGGSKAFQEEAKRDVKIWLDSWIIPACKQLIPELKEKKK